MTPVRIGTRGSALALWQADAVGRGLRAAGVEAEVVVIRTSGDRLQEAVLSEAGGKRLFVKEIEDALLDGRADVAVHSAKDLPVEMPDGLAVAAALPREEPWDAIVLPASAPRPDASLAGVTAALGPAPRLGTGSIRRITQLHRLLPAATFHHIRGNIDTRLRKLDDGRYDAIVLACAGLLRLGAGDRIACRLPLAACVPAPGQGCVAIQIREDAPAPLRAVLAALNDRASLAAVTAERQLVRVLGGGCQSPVGALALATGDDGLELHAAVTSIDGAQLRAMAFGRVDAPEALGSEVGERLLADGAAALLDASMVERADE